MMVEAMLKGEGRGVVCVWMGRGIIFGGGEKLVASLDACSMIDVLGSR